MKKLITLCIIIPCASQGFFADMDAFFDAQIKHMQEMRDSMQHMMAPMTGQKQNPSMNLDEQKDAIVITLSNIEASECSANYIEEQNRLSITADDLALDITVEDNYVTLLMHEESKKVSEKDDKDKDTPQIYQYGSRSYQTTRTITGKLTLEEQIIEYDKENRTLTITLPKKAPKKLGKPVPVHVKEGSQKTNDRSPFNEK